MKDITLDDLPSYPPVLEAALIARIHELNRDYLDLLIDRFAVADSAASSAPLPASVLRSLALLDHEQRRALARTPYTLYSLEFGNPSFWRTATAGSEEFSAPARYRSGEIHTQSAFCEVALFHAWHSAVSHPLAARVVYGMPDSVLQCLCAKPLWQVKRIALAHSRMLMPRWPSNPRFWPDLVRFAADKDQRRLTTAQLLGNQLLATELERAQRRVHSR